MRLAILLYVWCAALMIGCDQPPDSEGTFKNASTPATTGDSRTESQTQSTTGNLEAAATPPHTRQRIGSTEKQPVDSTFDDWIGVYCSPSESAGFTGTVLVLESSGKQLSYRMSFYSDVAISNSIEQDIESGHCLVDGDRLYLPRASGYYNKDSKPRLLATITRYTKVTLKGKTVLMGDRAYSDFQGNKIIRGDYGLLIKFRNKVDLSFDFANVKHPSLKTLWSPN